MCRSRRYQPTPPAMLTSESSPAFQAFGIDTADHPAVSAWAAHPAARPASPGSARKSQPSFRRMRPPGPSWYHGLPAAMAGLAAARASRSAVRNVSVPRRMKRRIRLVASAQAMTHFDLLADDRSGQGEQHGGHQRIRPDAAVELGKHLDERSPRRRRASAQQPAAAARIDPQPDRAGHAEEG